MIKIAAMIRKREVLTNISAVLFQNGVPASSPFFMVPSEEPSIKVVMRVSSVSPLAVMAILIAGIPLSVGVIPLFLRKFLMTEQTDTIIVATTTISRNPMSRLVNKGLLKLGFSSYGWL